MDLRKENERLSSLMNKRAGAAQRKYDLEQERAEIALQAHSGNRAARLRLTQLHKQIGTHDSEVLSIESAIAESQRRVAEAEADEADQVVRERACQARQLLDEMSAAGDAAEEGLAAFVERYARFQGVRPELVRVNARRAVSSTLGAPNVGLSELLPPPLRTTLGALVQRWRVECEHKVRVALGEQDEAAD